MLVVIESQPCLERADWAWAIYLSDGPVIQDSPGMGPVAFLQFCPSRCSIKRKEHFLSRPDSVFSRFLSVAMERDLKKGTLGRSTQFAPAVS